MFKQLLESEKGMTLVEIMVVIAIMGIVMAIVGVNVIRRFEKAKVDTTKAQIKVLEQALDQYYLENGEYPPSQTGLQKLVDDEYMKKIPKDGWKRDFHYASPGSEGNPYEIVSSGKDKQEGTGDDIKSWELE